MKADIVGVGKGGIDEMSVGPGAEGLYFYSRTGERSFLSTNVVNVEGSHQLRFFEIGRLADSQRVTIQWEAGDSGYCGRLA